MGVGTCYSSGVAVVDLAPPAVATPLLATAFTNELKGQKLMKVDALARAAIAGIDAGKTEITPGASKLLRAISRLAPRLGFHLMVKSTQSA